MTCLNQQFSNKNSVTTPLKRIARSAIAPAFLTVLTLSMGISSDIANANPLDHKRANSKPFGQNPNKTLADIRRATFPFIDVKNAIDAGYVSTVDLGAGCVSAESEGEPSQLGAMGIHFVNLAELGSPDFDFHTPSVLVYAPDPHVENCSYSTAELMADDNDCTKSLRLVAVEELIFADLWEASIDKPHWQQPPEFLGNQFYYIHDNPDTDWVDEAHGFPPHYELHIWLYDRNVAGLYSPWNPALSCPTHMQGHAH
ncbi:hypothetical protein [Aliiglaciecola litoralis]|uniref:Uncharacterized protein n=1 Tax=Aliiglaciecola litoralis TaxID=582857 RepID=A0ABN1LRB7_9ALTE